MLEKIKDEKTDKLAEALACLKTADEVYRFIGDICTISEITEMSKRLVAAEMLRDVLRPF